LSTQSRVLRSKAMIFSCKDRNLLLGNPGLRLSLVPLLLTSFGFVAPETRRGTFCFVVHCKQAKCHTNEPGQRLGSLCSNFLGQQHVQRCPYLNIDLERRDPLLAI
jgi:hypothetical protein